MNILALIAAGEIKEDDGVLGLIQNISLDTSKSVAQWLAIATKGPVKLRHLSFDGGYEIELTYEEALSKVKSAEVKTIVPTKKAT